ncbi:MAG: hypothetical protein RSF73_09910 [Ruthenibacterium sp.]
MNTFDSGIPYFTPKTAAVTVYFPTDRVQCQYCALFCRYEENFKRYSCRLTNEWLLDPLHTVGEQCPLKGEKT